MDKKLIASIGRAVGLVVLFLVGCYLGIYALIYFMFYVSDRRSLILAFMVTLVSAGLVVSFIDRKAQKQKHKDNGASVAQMSRSIINYRQGVCLWLGIVIIVLMGLFPAKENLSLFSNLPYFQIKPELHIKWAIVVLVTTSLVLALRDKKDKQRVGAINWVSGSITNRKQKASLWIGIAVIVLMCLFPPSGPWSNVGRGARSGYRMLLEGPNYAIELPKLYIQWAIVVVITTGFILTFKGRERNKNSD
jgi:hypothetical protein